MSTKYLKYCFVLLFNLTIKLSYCHYENDCKSFRETVKIYHNYFNQTSSINLYKDNIRIDSIKFEHVDFNNDTLINYENNWLYYRFNICSSCIIGSESSIQVVLKINNGKFHIAFVSDYRWILYKYNIITNDQQSDSLSFFSKIKKCCASFSQVTLGNKFFYNFPTVNEYYYSENSGLPIEAAGFIKSYNLQFDSTLIIFYNKKVVINDTCEFSINKKVVVKRVYLENETIFILDFYSTSFAFYEGVWYSYFKNNFIPLNDAFEVCPLNCM
jgi:hypothetical protein